MLSNKKRKKEINNIQMILFFRFNGCFMTVILLNSKTVNIKNEQKKSIQMFIVLVVSITSIFFWCIRRNVVSSLLRRVVSKDYCWFSLLDLC